MEYAPHIISAVPVKTMALGRHRVVLLTDIVSTGLVQYVYVMAVYEGRSRDPWLYVTAETHNRGAGQPPAPHYLCAFPGDCHENHGFWDDLTDAAAFETRALEIVRQAMARKTRRGRRRIR